MGNNAEHKRERNYISFVINYHIILLIPMLIIAFSIFFIVKEHNLNRAMTELRLKTESQSKYWGQEMSVVFLHYNDCRFSKIYSSAYEEGYPVAYLDIMQDLGKKEGVFPFIDRLYFYNGEEHKIFSSVGTYGEDIFFSGRCRMDQKVLDEAREKGMAAGKASFYSGSREGIVIAFPLHGRTEMERTDSRGQYLLFTISKDKLMEQFMPRGADGVTLITWEGEVIYQSTEGEIAEDEFEIYGQDMSNGFAVWNLASKKEIVRDSMQYLKSFALWFLVSLAVGIVLALVYSRKRYVIFHRLLNQSAALEDERNALQAESCLYELLTLKLEKGDELWQKCLECGIHIERKSQYIILFPKMEENEALKDYFVGMRREDPFASAYKINLFGELYSWLVLSGEEKEAIEQKLDNFALAGAQFERSEIFSDAGRIKESYEAVFQKIKRVHRKEDYPWMEMEALKEAAALDEKSRVEILLRELRGIIAEADEVTAILTCFETLYVLGVDFQKFYVLLRGKSFTRKDILRMFDCALEEKAAFTEEKDTAVSHPNYKKRSIMEILTYLHEHYLDPGFSVKYMAAYFNTSVSNLSHFFKKNMDVSISAYVDRIKLDKAKQLLRESDMKIGEIAELLQYGSSTGFAIMFKKYEGMTPKEFREHI